MGLEFLLLLACPLMMLFCMKGMFGGNKNKGSEGNSQVQASKQVDLHSMQTQMADLMEQNHKLTEEVNALKNESKDSKVVQLEKGQAKQEAL